MTDEAAGARSSPPGATLGDDGMRLTLDASRGPRISSLTARDGTELLATLSPPALAGDRGGDHVELTGGHRLWAAPEDPTVTYRLDEGPARFERDDAGGAQVADDGSPVARSLHVTVVANSAQVRHRLHNHGDRPVTLAPWAISQLRSGGHVVLPLSTVAIDEHGLQASGSLTTWPYTDLADPRITFRDEAVVVTVPAGGDDLPPTKLGVDGFAGWLAYVRDDLVLVVRFPPRVIGAPYADLGAAAQTYVAPRYVEVESLGPVSTVPPGGTVTHVEHWTLHRHRPDGPVPDVATVRELAASSSAPRPRRDTPED